MDALKNTIFEYDAAFDELGMVLQDLIKNIRQGFEYLGTRYEDRGYYLILSNIDIVLVLCKHYDTYPDIESSEIAKWKQDFLNTYGQKLDEKPTSQEYKKKQKDIIISTFDRLLDYVTKYEEESS